jgi:uncharacterized protein YkwD
VSSPKRVLCVLALIAAWILLPAGSAAATECANTDVEVTGLTQNQMEDSIACLINEERTSRGLGAVQPNGDLQQAALRHSNEMVKEGYFDHTAPDGVTFIDRIQATGYMRSARLWVVGENLVWGTGPLSTPEALVTAWMNSPPHRENLLRDRFREIGIAAVVGTPESQYDSTGVTVSSEYGYRYTGKTRHAYKAKARKAKHRHAKGKRHRRR